MCVIGWKLSYHDRAALFERFPPVWPEVLADHIILEACATENDPFPAAYAGKIVGRANDGNNGLEILVVAVDGNTRRPDGHVLHIIWSFDRTVGGRPDESDGVLVRQGWRRVEPPVDIGLVPARWA